MTETIDVSALPTHGFDSRGLVWWGIAGFIAIETTMLVLVVISYFYLFGRAAEWPIGRRQPALGWPSFNLISMLLSVVPMYWTDRKAHAFDRPGVQIGLVICSVWGLCICAVRPWEFAALGVSWDQNAYGSAVWTLLGLHSGHLIAEVLETIVMAAFMLRSGPVAPKYFVDTSDNAFYWYFIVAIWIPVYATIFWAPRWLG